MIIITLLVCVLVEGCVCVCVCLLVGRCACVCVCVCACAITTLHSTGLCASVWQLWCEVVCVSVGLSVGMRVCEGL